MELLSVFVLVFGRRSVKLYCKHRIRLFVFWSSTGKQGVTGQHAETVAEYTYFCNKHNNKVRATRSAISPGVIHSVTASNT
jgi:hypothetical protein